MHIFYFCWCVIYIIFVKTGKHFFFQALSGLNEILKQFSYDNAIKSFPNLFNIIFLTFAALIDVGSPIRGTNKNLFVSFKEVYDINPAK